jgi:phospholipid/cholesterol/gamma-HCH transport system substrate-binding protein
MKSNAIETIIGGAVIVIAAAFFTYVYKTADLRAGTGGYSLTARFESVDGITTGTDVRMAGIKIGTVTRQELDTDTYEAVLTISVDSTVKLPIDSSAKITSDGLLGDRYVSLDPGGDPTLLADGGVIDYTQSALDLFGLIGNFLFQDTGTNTDDTSGGDGSQ